MFKFISDVKFEEVDCLPACQLAEVVLQHCRLFFFPTSSYSSSGSADEFVAQVIDVAVKRLAVANRSSLKILLIDLVRCLFFLNSSLRIVGCKWIVLQPSFDSEMLGISRNHTSGIYCLVPDEKEIY